MKNNDNNNNNIQPRFIYNLFALDKIEINLLVWSEVTKSEEKWRREKQKKRKKKEMIINSIISL